ncbi:glutathione S-transferase N-terminal domain-containing protein [Metallumcola ferriviriculae]|uniref:Glutathione S-transferase N-terminal domain-containing protein n=1 Tax=Metallumcola ferriviriculae TaxID=3039180 RepID=A0AAU0USJ3_9FIRM|nr:glutathione S-transferase N-terminal domain-containing protein [Desulfitibacteraceae bacterium MK1]
MKEYLSQKGVSFKELDVSSDEAARDEMHKKTGMMAVPVIAIDGEVIVGFDRQAIDKKLH